MSCDSAVGGPPPFVSGSPIPTWLGAPERRLLILAEPHHQTTS